MKNNIKEEKFMEDLMYERKRCYLIDIGCRKIIDKIEKNLNHTSKLRIVSSAYACFILSEHQAYINYYAQNAAALKICLKLKQGALKNLASIEKISRQDINNITRLMHNHLTKWRMNYGKYY